MGYDFFRKENKYILDSIDVFYALVDIECELVFTLRAYDFMLPAHKAMYQRQLLGERITLEELRNV